MEQIKENDTPYIMILLNKFFIVTPFIPYLFPVSMKGDGLIPWKKAV